MKNVLIFVLAAALLVFSACSVSGKKSAEDKEITLKQFVAESKDQKVEFPYNSRVTVTEGVLETRAFGSDNVEQLQGDFKINGVGIGKDYEAFAEAFDIQENFAMWETCLRVDENEVLFNYQEYSDDAVEFEKFDDVFLTVGFCVELSEENNQDAEMDWKMMEYSDLSDAWNLELLQYKTKKMQEICFVSAGFDEEGVIDMLDVYYGSYEDYSTLENYRENVDYFADEEVTEIEETAVEE